MNSELISALIERNAFADDTIITARYQSMDLFGRVFNKTGEFKVKRIVNDPARPLFELVTLQDGTTIVKAYADAIKAVDGMDVERFADIYDLLPDGSKKKVGRKRGRKPKNQLSA
jgi:Mg/Co/Ni transporter MgtE